MAQYYLPKVNVQFYQGEELLLNLNGIVTSEFNSDYSDIVKKGTVGVALNPPTVEFDWSSLDTYASNKFKDFPRIIISPSESTFPYFVCAFVGHANGQYVSMVGAKYAEGDVVDSTFNTAMTSIQSRVLVAPYFEFVLTENGTHYLLYTRHWSLSTPEYGYFALASGDVVDGVPEYVALGELSGVHLEPSGPIYFNGESSHKIEVYEDFNSGAKLLLRDWNNYQRATSSNAEVEITSVYEYMMVKIPSTVKDSFTITYSYNDYSDTLRFIYGTEPGAENDPYAPGGNSGPGGGNGNFGGDNVSEDITGMLPNGSSESNSSSTGLFTRYAVNNSELQSVGFALYAETILAQATKAVMSFLWNSPSEALISLISYPFDVASILNTTPSSVKFGAIDLEAVTASRLNGTFAQIDWGTIQLSEYWGNFLDYAPHTKIELYLPWCTGSVSIDPHEVLPGSISVKTNIEISKGTCVHNVFGNKGALIGTYSGTCGSQLPMTALDTSGKALALVTAAAGALVAGAAAGGGASAGIAAANSPHTTAMAYSLENSRGLDPMAARVIAQREAISIAEAPYRAIERRASQAALVSSVAAFRTPATIQRNGSFTGNGAGMAIQFPFIIVSRPEQNIPKNYGHFFGYPSNVYTTIGSVSGYTEIGSIHVNGLTGATLDEIEEVERLLKGGVIL